MDVARDGTVFVTAGVEPEARILKVDPSGNVSTVAGTGQAGFSGDGGPATEARIGRAFEVALDGEGNLYFTDVPNYRVRKVDTSGVITTVAGTGKPGFSGDGGPARAARLGELAGVTVDREGNIYVLTLDPGGNRRIHKRDREGRITILAGDGNSGFYGDGGPATKAAFSEETGGVILAPDGALFIGDVENARVRKVCL